MNYIADPNLPPFVEQGFALPHSLVAVLRSAVLPRAAEALGADRIGEIEKLTDGVWWTIGAIDRHVDNLPPLTLTTGLIIANDCQSQLWADGNCFDIPPGSIYRIDSRKSHGTTLRHGVGNNAGMFIFLAWDCPILDAKPIREWAMEACDDLSYWSHQYRGTPPGRPDFINKVTP